MLSKLKFDINRDDFREGLTAVISVKGGKNLSLKGQTKTKLGNTEVGSSCFSGCIVLYWIIIWKNIPKDAKAIVDKVILAATARHAARKATGFSAA